MSSPSDLQRVLDSGIVAIIRATSGEQLVNVARALHEGGIDVIEVTFTVPNVLEILAAVRKDLGQKILLGAGTVLDPETCRAALLAGAEFIVSPSLNLEVIKLCKRYGKLVMPGAFTPTEIVTAWEAGADIVKLFPADCVGPNPAMSDACTSSNTETRERARITQSFVTALIGSSSATMKMPIVGVAGSSAPLSSR